MERRIPFTAGYLAFTLYMTSENYMSNKSANRMLGTRPKNTLLAFSVQFNGTMNKINEVKICTQTEHLNKGGEFIRPRAHRGGDKI
jgi:hypothetical protein